MKLSELEDGTSLSFELHIEGKKFEFPTTVRFQRKGKIYFEPVRVKDKILNIQAENVRVDLLLNVVDDKPLMWLNITVQAELYKKAIYFTVDSSCDGKKYNRRGAYRQYIGDEVYAHVGSHKSRIQVLLKDISNTGFAFIYKDKLDDADETGPAMVVIEYTYKDSHTSFALTLVGVVVRTQEVSKGKMLHGCTLLKRNDLISKFVNYKQIEQIGKMHNLDHYVAKK